MKLRLFYGFLGVLLFIQCTKIEELRQGEMKQAVIYESKFNVAFPGITRFKTGQLAVVFREDSLPSSTQGRILFCKSEDQGKSWTLPQTIVSTAWDCRNPSIVQLRDGVVLVNFFQSRFDPQTGAITPMGCFFVRSFDNGQTFTAPRMVRIPDVDWAATSDAVLELDDGSLVFPTYGGKNGESTAALVVLSRDRGETWEEIYLIAKDPENKISYEEPVLIQFPNKKILCMIKTSGTDRFLYQSVSEDGAKTWSPLASSSIQGQSVDLHLTPDGTVLCAYRDFWPEGVSFVRSYDWGRTWEKEMQLCANSDERTRPSMVTLDKDFLAVFSAGGGDQMKANEKSAVVGTFFAVRKPEKPKGLSVSVVDKGQVRLRWNSVKGAVYYVVYRDSTENFVPQPGIPFRGNGIATPTSLTYTDARVDSGQVYYYRVAAVAGSGEILFGTGSESDPTEAMKVKIE